MKIELTKKEIELLKWRLECFLDESYIEHKDTKKLLIKLKELK